MKLEEEPKATTKGALAAAREGALVTTKGETLVVARRSLKEACKFWVTTQ